MNEHLQSQLDVSVDCVVFGFHNNKLRVLVIEQENVSNNLDRRYALPGDLVLPDEHIDHAAERVLFELTNLKGIYLEQFHTFGNPNRVRKEDDIKWLNVVRKNPDARVITIAYYALVKMEDYTPSPSSYAEKAEWKDILDVPELVFDHNKILRTALKKLRKEVSNNAVGFELLPEKFTLGQLQQLYEVILDMELDKRNFRKAIKKMDNVLALEEKQKGVLHKPAQLFTYVGKRKEVD
ncbi:MAG: NUDIX hydrolase [Flavobacteriales bacterium]|nr:NUDIX hydrolase [Flavobacteriales bacterium]